jgi:hypothetical protein
VPTPEIGHPSVEDALTHATPAPTPPLPAAPGVTLRGRQPAASVIAECLRLQALARPRSLFSRVFGRSPLTAESQPWYAGALGELDVARRLDALGPGWHVLHAVPVGTGSSDIDHVVIGPPGVFTINTKHHAGQDVWVGARRLLVAGQKTDHLRNARYEGTRAGQRLSAAVPGRVEVVPIIAIVGARRFTIRERPADVVVLREHRLISWLRRLTPVVPPATVERLADAAAEPSTWHRAPHLGPVDLDAFRALRGEVARSRRRRRGWALAILLAFILAIPVGLLALWNELVATIVGIAA